MRVSPDTSRIAGFSFFAPAVPAGFVYMTSTAPPKEIFILGKTKDGRTFRPSDWSERLAGVMSQFRPPGMHPGNRLVYSPWCVPTVLDGVRCVVVNEALREHEPMAWDFVMNFARDNQLETIEACLLPDAKPR